MQYITEAYHDEAEIQAKIYMLRANGYSRVQNAYWAECWTNGESHIILVRDY